MELITARAVRALFGGTCDLVERPVTAGGQALTLLGLKVDVMSEGCRYDLIGRQAYPPDEHAAFCALPNRRESSH